MIVLGVEIGQLAEVIWVSLLAGVGITACFAFAIFGMARMAEAQRAGRGGATVGYGAIALTALLVFAAAVVVAVEVMLAK
jgi:hypothetical protein